jgi:hypothetical protein
LYVVDKLLLLERYHGHLGPRHSLRKAKTAGFETRLIPLGGGARRVVDELWSANTAHDPRARARPVVAVDVELVVAVERIEQTVDVFSRRLDVEPEIAEKPPPDDRDFLDRFRD